MLGVLEAERAYQELPTTPKPPGVAGVPVKVMQVVVPLDTAGRLIPLEATAGPGPGMIHSMMVLGLQMMIDLRVGFVPMICADAVESAVIVTAGEVTVCADAGAIHAARSSHAAIRPIYFMGQPFLA